MKTVINPHSDDGLTKEVRMLMRMGIDAQFGEIIIVLVGVVLMISTCIHLFVQRLRETLKEFRTSNAKNKVRELLLDLVGCTLFLGAVAMGVYIGSMYWSAFTSVIHEEPTIVRGICVDASDPSSDTDRQDFALKIDNEDRVIRAFANYIDITKGNHYVMGLYEKAGFAFVLRETDLRTGEVLFEADAIREAAP